MRRTNRPWLRTKPAGAYSGYAPSTLEKLRHTGGGPIYYKTGKIVVYHPDDLDDWIEQTRRRSTSDDPHPQEAA
jgi:hypothetical protein